MGGELPVYTTSSGASGGLPALTILQWAAGQRRFSVGRNDDVWVGSTVVIGHAA